MAEADVEAAVVANGSGPLEDKGAETVPESKGRGEMKDSEERKDGEEKKDSKEKKDGEQNGGGREEDEREVNVEKKTEDVDMAEAGDAEDVEKAGKEDEGEEEEKPNRESEVKEDKEVGDGENQDAEVSKRKRARGRKVSEKGNKKEKKETGTKVKESPKTPAPSSIERPVRERKTVERLVEVIEKEPNKGFQIEKGRGTPLKDIPNVAYKLARKKAADLKFLHQTLFGRKGKTINFKSHILQFSGFPWHESDEKQRAKMKEKLDKYVKDTLVDMCDLFDIPVAKATTKKEDLVVKILDFMVAPHAMTDVILADKDQQSSKSRKRKRVAKGSTSKITEGMFAKRSRKKRTKGEGMQDTKGKKEEMEDEDNEEDENDDENGVHDEDESLKNSDSDEREKELEEEEDDDDEHPKNGKRDMKKSSKQRGSSRKEKMKVGTSPKKALVTIAKSPSKSSSSKHLAEESNVVGAKVFSRKKKNDETPRTKSRSKPDKKEKTTGKRTATGKGKSEEAKQSGPSKDELRKTICEILKEVDFNTATFTDILKQLAAHYKMDLTSRKSSIKLMIQEELTKLADEAEENEDDEDDEVAEKGDNPKPTGKELET